MDAVQPESINFELQAKDYLNVSQSNKTPRFQISKEQSKAESMRLKAVLSLNPSPAMSPLNKVGLPMLNVPRSSAGSRRVLDFAVDEFQDEQAFAKQRLDQWSGEVPEEGSMKGFSPGHQTRGPRIEGVKAPEATSRNQDISSPETPTSRSNMIRPQPIRVLTDNSFGDKRDGGLIFQTSQHGLETDRRSPTLILQPSITDRNNQIFYGDGPISLTDRSWNKSPTTVPVDTTASGLNLKQLLETAHDVIVAPGYKFDQTSQLMVPSNVIDMKPDVNLFLKTQRTLESATRRDHPDPMASQKGNMSSSQVRISQIRSSWRKIDDSRVSMNKNPLSSSRLSHDGVNQPSARRVVYGKQNSNLVSGEGFTVAPKLLNWRFDHEQHKAEQAAVLSNQTIQEQESEVYDQLKIPQEAPLVTEVIHRGTSDRDLSAILRRITPQRSRMRTATKSCTNLCPKHLNPPILELFGIPTTVSVNMYAKSKSQGRKMNSPIQPERPKVSWLSLMRGEYRTKGFFELGEREHQDTVVWERMIVWQTSQNLPLSRQAGYFTAA